MSHRHAAAHPELHRIDRIGWLRAAVLGANDGIVSTASLIVGVAAAGQSHGTILLSGLAGLVGGAMSMAAGEYVSVSSQADAEKAAQHIEQAELHANPEAEHAELIQIYEDRGLPHDLATQVADALSAHDPLQAHMRDELGITDVSAARPVQAALSSALSFTAGAIVPLGVAMLIAVPQIPLTVTLVSLLCLAILGGAGAKTGGAPMVPGIIRVTFWSAAAMGATALVGTLFGTALG